MSATNLGPGLDVRKKIPTEETILSMWDKKIENHCLVMYVMLNPSYCNMGTQGEVVRNLISTVCCGITDAIVIVALSCHSSF